MTDKQEKIDVYECHFYRQNRLLWCSYYPKGCNKCGYLIKVGEKYQQSSETQSGGTQLMKLSEVYRYGLLGLFKAIILILLETILVIMLVMTLPLWWLKPVQKLLSNFGNLIEKVIEW